ncbi:MAG TPA: hypothetical protein VGC25_01975 [Alphaproteobacteria bacterium]
MKRIFTIALAVAAVAPAAILAVPAARDAVAQDWRTPTWPRDARGLWNNEKYTRCVLAMMDRAQTDVAFNWLEGYCRHNGTVRNERDRRDR